MTATIEQFTRGESIPVALGAIERELGALWRKLADARGGEAVTRACLWNLIVRTDSEAGFAHAKRVVDEISPDLPARVLVLKTERQAPPSLRAWIEGNWHEAGGGRRQIGSDEITLVAGGEAVDDLAQVVRALLVADVPTAALWCEASPDTASALDRELLAAADRLVVTGESAPQLRALASLLGDERRAPAIGVGWLRAAGWRAALATLFDPPTPVEEVLGVDAVAIRCSPARAGAAEMLVAWLASRLRWREGARLPSGELEFKRPRGLVRVRFAFDDEAADPFASVTLTTASGDYSVERAGAQAIINTPALAWKQPFPLPDDRELWIAALGARGRDPLFSEALRRAAALWP